MEDLRGLVLDGLHLHLVRWVLPLAVPQRLLQPLRRVQRDRVPPRPQELIKVLKNILVETNISLSGTNIFIWNKHFYLEQISPFETNIFIWNKYFHL